MLKHFDYTYIICPLCKFADGGFISSSKFHIQCTSNLLTSVSD